MIEDLKILLGDAADNYTDAQLELYLRISTAEVETYCNRKIDADFELQLLVQRIAVIKLNRMNTEGLASQSFSGVSESYIDGYPADITAALNRKRKIKTL